eukprot:885000_1
MGNNVVRNQIRTPFVWKRYEGLVDLEPQSNTANNQVQQPCLSSHIIEGLIKYNEIVNDNAMKPNEIHFSNLEEILNQFEDILEDPDQNQLLSSIFSKSKHCEVSKCVMFQRNCRNRSKYNNKTSIYELYKMNDDRLIANCQLMDKIHCFFHHSYDDGNRLSIEEQNTLNKYDPGEQQFAILKHILSTKNMNRTSPIMREMRNRMCKKFQLHAREQHEYIFGCQFDYDYDEKGQDNFSNNRMVHFTPKYNNHKEELTQNDICQITIDQYMNEFNKAHILYNTR